MARKNAVLAPPALAETHASRNQCYVDKIFARLLAARAAKKSASPH